MRPVRWYSHPARRWGRHFRAILLARQSRTLIPLRFQIARLSENR